MGLKKVKKRKTILYKLFEGGKVEQAELDYSISKIIYNPLRKKSLFAYFFLVLFVIPIFLFFMVSFIEGSLFMGNLKGTVINNKFDDIGFLEDFMRIAVVLMHTVVIFLSLNLAKKTVDYLSSLKNIIDKEYIPKFETNLKHYVGMITFKNKKALKFRNFLHIAGFVSIIYNWVIYSNDLTGFDFQNYWADKNHPLGLGVWLLYLILTNLIFYPICVCHIFSILITIRNIFRDLKKNDSYAIHLYPYQIGNSDGWKGIKEIVLNLYLLFVPIIMYTFLYMSTLDFDTLFTSAFLLFLALFVFIVVYPLSKSHAVIKKVKRNEISQLEMKYNLQFKKIKAYIKGKKNPDTNKIIEAHKSLEYLSNMLQVQRKIPEWPLKVPKFKIAWIYATILSPLITFILDRYIFN